MQANQQADPLSVQISEKLKNLAPPSSKSCIFKVHKQLRRINEKAYEPEIIAIGPYHHGKPNLKMMEEHKLRYLKHLLQREGKDNADEYIHALRSLESKAQTYYAESIKLETDDFIEMMLLDGCFVIEVIRKFNDDHSTNKNDPIFEMKWMVTKLKRDLMLLENQLPFFVLCELFDNEGDKEAGVEIKKSERDSTEKGHEEKDSVLSDTELLKAGVKIKKVESAGTEKGSLFYITFENKTILVPPLDIEDNTETFLRNLIVYEQYNPHIQWYITDYISFMDCLIDSSNDVEILCHCGILNNLLGDKEVVRDLFSKLGDEVITSGEDTIYANKITKINEHCRKRRYKWLAKLNRDYFNGPWAIISVVAAFVLLVLTSVQTYFTVFPR